VIIKSFFSVSRKAREARKGFFRGFAAFAGFAREFKSNYSYLLSNMTFAKM
jgi:hypothetical protein